jgi:hypothetical protein
MSIAIAAPSQIRLQDPGRLPIEMDKESALRKRGRLVGAAHLRHGAAQEGEM